MKRPEDMTDAELSAELASYQGQAQPTQTGINMAAMKRPEDMTDAELAQELAGYKSGALNQEKIDISNEAADIPWQDRLIVKNLGGSVEDQVSYLRQRNPYLDIRAHEGDIIAKIPGEQKFKRLDPSWSASPQELVQDITDIGYDVGSGILTGAAGAAGAVPGALAGFGVGGLGTAVAASGAANAGLEGFRQVLGKAAGARKDISGGEIALSGILGGATTGLFGGGASSKQIAKAASTPDIVARILDRTKLGYLAKGSAPTDIQQTLVKDYLTESQKGVFQKAGSKALSVLSGAAPKETLENAVKDIDQNIVGDLIESGLEINPNKAHTNQEIAVALKQQGGLEGFGGVASDTIFSTIQNKQDELGEVYKNVLDNSGSVFELTELKPALEELIEKTKNSEIPAVNQQADAARAILAKYFTPKVEISGPVFNDAGEEISKEYLKNYKGPWFDEFGEMIERRDLRAGKKTYVTGSEAMDINNSLAAFMDYTKSPIAISNKSAEDKMLRKLVGKSKENLQTQIYDYIDDTIGKSGDETLKEAYAKNRNFMRNVAKYFVTPEKTVKTLESINNQSMRVFKERLKEFDDYNGTNVLKLAELADVAKYFGDPSLEAISSGGATSTGKILRASELLGSAAYAGGLLTGVAGVAPAALQAGKGIGAILASPAAVSSYLSGKTSARRAGESAVKLAKIPELKKYLLDINEKYAADELKKAQEYLTPQAAAQSAWQLMGGQ